MKTMNVNNSNDIYLDSKGNIAISSKEDALGNIIKNSVQTVLGELIFDKDLGVPYFDSFLSKNPDWELFRYYIIAAIERVEEVNRVYSFDYSTEDEKFSYEASISTIYGDIKING